ncbi:C40 family peptidase [Limnohabitans radicicola]|uniref:C40 family peptidase n=1 Tax=Limnohabitans radicicola TaxID=2771427 RepID=A0A927FGJ8_9BURK|nr:C40 family peptidase [Limnohabitans radicicola]MBD8050177.1 C40 family peptidase [Limnohabitans radicicola]
MNDWAPPLHARGTTRHAWAWRVTVLLVALVLGACTSTPPQSSATPDKPSNARANPVRSDIALYALSLLDTRYSWGGKGPATGFDCSGLVSHIYREAAGVQVAGSAVSLGQMSRPIDPEKKQPGDLVFFNTLGSRHSHVGVYIGNGRFIHASNPRSGVRVDLLSNRYFAQRFEGVHTLLD